MGHKHRRTYEGMKLAHRERLVAYMKDLDRIDPSAWSFNYPVLRRFMHGLGAEAFLDPILYDLKEEGLLTYTPPLIWGSQVYLTPKWGE